MLPLSYVTAQNQSNEYKIKKVVIDAGHGGRDSGARGKTAMEKDIALAKKQKASCQDLEAKLAGLKAQREEAKKILPGERLFPDLCVL